jgi:DNA (cytosine-5)-methyltransferase 1
MSLTYASLCDGIGAAHAAWQPLGWRCAWTSEIADFPAAVVAARWGFPNLGDMTRITDEQIEQHPRPELVVGGTPCQSFSVAGLRAGLADPRGNLALVYLGLVDRLRPRWVAWKNVPGVLSSNGGRDFGTFLGALGELGYGWAYRVLDAQYFGVPQRRRRVFVVGCSGGWARAAAVLLDRESLSGHPPPRRQEGASVARALTSSTGGASAKEQQFTFVSGDGKPLNGLCEGEGVIAHALTGNGFDAKPHVFGGNLAPRRLTPRECERLQGFPDDHTLIPGASDSRRYQALGNSMAVPVMRWIGERIAAVHNLTRHPQLSLTQ